MVRPACPFSDLIVGRSPVGRHLTLFDSILAERLCIRVWRPQALVAPIELDNYGLYVELCIYAIRRT